LKAAFGVMPAKAGIHVRTMDSRLTSFAVEKRLAGMMKYSDTAKSENRDAY